jgi:hypothetical protein
MPLYNYIYHTLNQNTKKVQSRVIHNPALSTFIQLTQSLQVQLAHHQQEIHYSERNIRDDHHQASQYNESVTPSAQHLNTH